MNLGKAPAHLKAYPWYLPHQAWLEAIGYNHHDAEGAAAKIADLREADLRWADLRAANLSWADLSKAYLRWANLSEADLRGAYLREADIPTIKDLDGKVLAALSENINTLDMSTWHKCETTHCRAGWYIHFAGEKGSDLENKYGSSVAGALIFSKAYPGERVPNWTATNDEAMADMRRLAKV